jgi:drug/metabolite transporter (DMT)-like permease
MKLFLLTVVTMSAFAANSILNRAAVDGAGMSPFDFALLRVWAGALTLAVLTMRAPAVWRGLITAKALAGGATLTIYMIGFSAAYLTLDAGVGALILFGVVQLAMFTITSLRGVPPRALQLIGAGVAFAGLIVLLWPAGGVALDAVGVGAMIAAGLGWAVYSILGQGVAAPVVATARNFALSAVMVAPLVFAFGGGSEQGVTLAVISGVVTSALGYSLWYQIVPRLGASKAALAQLSVPVIAVAGGAILFGEAITPRMIIAGLLVVGGLGIGLIRR